MKIPIVLAALALVATAAPAEAQSRPALAFDRPVRGELTRTDERDSEGGAVDRYLVTVKRGQVVRIIVHSPNFAPGLILTDTNNRILKGSDGGMANPRQILEFRAPADATYVLHVFGQMENDLGAYRLEMGDATASSEGGAWPELVAGDRIDGALGAGDRRIEMLLFDGYELAAFKGDVLTLKLSARGFKASLIVQADGERVFDGTAAPDAVVQLKPKQDTIYRVIVTDLNDERGPYTLSVTPSR